MVIHVANIMTENPVIIRPEHTLYAAMLKMEEVGCHHLPVISADKHLIGVITDRDCRIALRLPTILQEHRDNEDAARRLVVRDVMTPAPIVTESQIFAEEAARLMLVHNVSCLPVMRAETLVGIVTTSDILIAFMNMQKRSEDPAE